MASYDYGYPSSESYSKDPKDKGDIIVDMNQEVLIIMVAMMKKPNGGGTNIMKIGAKMWQSLIFHLKNDLVLVEIVILMCI